MANRVEGVTEKLEECARREFLEKGFEGASLRTIAQQASTTPRSIYTRYGDKEGLFAALVEPAHAGLRKLYIDTQEAYSEKPAEVQSQLFHSDVLEVEYEGTIDVTMDYIYAHFDAFQLLVCCAEGTKYADFVEDMALLDEAYTLKFIEATGNDVITSGRAGKPFIHMLCGAYMHAFFEIVRHNMPKSEAYTYVNQLRRFYECGWDDLFHPKTG